MTSADMEMTRDGLKGSLYLWWSEVANKLPGQGLGQSTEFWYRSRAEAVETRH